MTIDVLIGHTGFVGRNLNAPDRFSLCCNTGNVEEIHGQEFGTVVCAAAPGSMFEANSAPERDIQRILALQDHLSQMRARTFVLVSTIAVLDSFDGHQDEETDEFQTKTPYGLNRRKLEEFCQARFESCLIVRLPALFGVGLQKNFLFDIMNPAPSMLTPRFRETIAESLSKRLFAEFASYYSWNPTTKMHVLDRAAFAGSEAKPAIEAELTSLGLTSVQFTNPASTFQYYGLRNLWTDICKARDAGLGVAHLATEPLRAADVHLHLTGREMQPNQARIHKEDFWTRHSSLFGGNSPYIKTSTQVLKELSHWASQKS